MVQFLFSFVEDDWIIFQNIQHSSLVTVKKRGKLYNFEFDVERFGRQNTRVNLSAKRPFGLVSSCDSVSIKRPECASLSYFDDDTTHKSYKPQYVQIDPVFFVVQSSM